MLLELKITQRVFLPRQSLLNEEKIGKNKTVARCRECLLQISKNTSIISPYDPRCTNVHMRIWGEGRHKYLSVGALRQFCKLSDLKNNSLVSYVAQKTEIMFTAMKIAIIQKIRTIIDYAVLKHLHYIVSVFTLCSNPNSSGEGVLMCICR